MTARFILSVGNEARSPNRAFFDYDQREEISLADAVFWASSLSFEVTLYAPQTYSPLPLPLDHAAPMQ
jgi:hypothetical protein